MNGRGREDERRVRKAARSEMIEREREREVEGRRIEKGTARTMAAALLPYGEGPPHPPLAPGPCGWLISLRNEREGTERRAEERVNDDERKARKREGGDEAEREMKECESGW
jgi:hypothetical protein